MTSRSLWSCALLAIVLAALPSAVAAQTADLTIDAFSDEEYPTVEVTVTVPPELSDVGLSKDAFTVTENGDVVRPYLGTSPDVEDPPPPKVVLAIDVSGSMRDSIDEARAAAHSFLDGLPDDSLVALLTFGDSVEVLVQPTANLAAVRSRIDELVASDETTALYSGVEQAADLLTLDPGEQGRVVVLSDGQDTADGDQDAAIAALRGQRAQLWAVALPGEENVPALKTLAGDDGRVLSADADELDEVYAGLATDLASTYVLRYDSQADGETDLSVALDYGSLHAQRTRTVVIDGEGATPAEAAAPVTAVNARPVVITVPLLGTTGAFVVGLGALGIGGFVLLLFVLLPRVPRPRERLFTASQQHRGQTARLSSIAQWTTDAADRRLRRGTLGERLDRSLEQAGVNLRPGELAVIVFSMVVVAYTIGAVAVNPLFGILLVPIPVLLGRLWLSIRRERRHARFAEQLTDILQLVASSLRAGYGLVQGIDAVSRDAEEPAASEFRRIILEHRLGRDLDEAMQNCAARMDNEDFSWVVQAISIHRDVGGDLSKVLDNIIATIRDRADVQRQVRTLSAEGRMSARVLTALPILVLILLMITSPEYMSTLTTEPLGLVLLAIAALLMLIGVLVVRRMANIKY